MFFEQEENEIDPKDYIPILNKSSQAPIEASPTPSNSETETTQNNNQNCNNNNNSEQHKNKSKIKIPSIYSEFFEFMAYEHFSLSKLTIKEMCKPGTACDVHIYFYEDFTQLPQIGISCLSFNDLWSEQAEMQGNKTKPEELSFIKLINYKENMRHWMDIEPLAFQILTISLDCSDKKGIKIRFSLMKEPPSNWFWLKYPILVNDFSLVIGIEKKALLRRYTFEGKVLFEGSLEVLTSFGLLKQLFEQQKKEKENLENIKIVDLEEEKQKINEKEECIFCFRKGSNTLFYPCNHCVVHNKCLIEKNVDKCYLCNVKCEKLIKLKFPISQFKKSSKECLFCEYGNCQKFDCYYYPCGCTLGCFEGFKKALEKRKSKMSLRCLNCGNMIENVMQFYRG